MRCGAKSAWLPAPTAIPPFEPVDVVLLHGDACIARTRRADTRARATVAHMPRKATRVALCMVALGHVATRQSVLYNAIQNKSHASLKSQWGMSQ